MKKQLSPILAPLSKTNIDSNESANYDVRLFPPELGVCIHACRMCLTQGVRVGVQGFERVGVNVKSQLAYVSASEAE